MDKVALQQGWQVINITPEACLVFLRHAVDSKVNVAALVVVSSGARAKEKDFFCVIFFAQSGDEGV